MRGPVSLREGRLLLGGWSENHSKYNGKVYPLADRGIARVPLRTAADPFGTSLRPVPRTTPPLTPGRFGN